MTAHIDVMSYLLTVLTFSVGFLSARRHAHFDVLTKDLADRSWKIRQALNAGQDLGPRDLAEDIAAVTVDPDSVATFTRFANTCLFGAVAAVFVAALRTTDIIDHGGFLATVVLISAVVVFVLGEYDVRWMARKERTLASGSILGQLSSIDHALRTGHPRRAATEIAQVLDEFPRWSFARELAVFARLARDPEPVPLSEVEELMELDTHHVAPVLVAEAYLRDGDPVGALQEVGVLRTRMQSARAHAQLDDAVAFAAGLPRWLVNARPTFALGTVSAGVDVDAQSLPFVRQAASSFHRYLSDEDVDGWLDQAGETVPASLVGFALGRLDREQEQDLLRTAVQSRRLVGALNSLGLACLCRHLDQEALEVFDAAIQARPNSSTSHWGHGVACHRRNWPDAALVSLGRAENLDPRNPFILRLTRVAFTEGLSGTDQDFFRHFQDGPSELERLQAALLGLEITTPSHTRGVQRRVVDALVGAATTPRPHAVQEAT